MKTPDLTHKPQWNHWNTTRTGMANTDPATLRYGTDVSPAVGMLFQAQGYRPMSLSSMSSPDDGGVVTHSLQWIGKDGTEQWTCNDDSTRQDDFKKLWPDVVIFPDDWKFKERDYQEGMDQDFARKAA